jgi:hypothetical protein
MSWEKFGEIRSKSTMMTPATGAHSELRYDGLFAVPGNVSASSKCAECGLHEIGKHQFNVPAHGLGHRQRMTTLNGFGAFQQMSSKVIR